MYKLRFHLRKVRAGDWIFNEVAHQPQCSIVNAAKLIPTKADFLTNIVLKWFYLWYFLFVCFSWYVFCSVVLILNNLCNVYFVLLKTLRTKLTSNRFSSNISIVTRKKCLSQQRLLDSLYHKIELNEDKCSATDTWMRKILWLCQKHEITSI